MSIFSIFPFIYVLGHIFCSIKLNLLFLEAQQNLDQADLFTVVVYMNYVVKKFKKFNLKLGQILKKSKNAHIFQQKPPRDLILCFLPPPSWTYPPKHPPTSPNHSYIQKITTLVCRIICTNFFLKIQKRFTPYLHLFLE